MKFRELELGDEKFINDFADFSSRDFFGWDYCFPMAWVWDVTEGKHIYSGDGFALIKTEFYGKTIFNVPYMRDIEMLNDCLLLIKDYCAEKNIRFRVAGLSKGMADRVNPDIFAVESIRDSADYIYSSEKLRSLSGKKLHAKRNFVNRFEQKYPFEFREYTPADFEEVIKLYTSWEKSTEHETMNVEKKAIKRALSAYIELGLKIGLLFSEEKLIGFSVSYANNPHIGQVLFEKADVNYEGVYQALNKYSATAFLSGVEYVNRQEDMGIEGLRKAKLSYYPEFLVEKYNVRLK